MLRLWKGFIMLVLLLVVFYLPNGVQAAEDITGERSDKQNSLVTEKMVLNYLFCTTDEKLQQDLVKLQKELKLSNEQMGTIKDLAMQEGLEIQIKQRSDRQDYVYNKAMTQIAFKHDVLLQALLGDNYEKFIQWLNQWWEEEKQFRKQWLAKHRADGYPDTNKEAGVRSVDDRELVYATQYDGNTDDEVALPDKYVKFANRGWTSSIPSSYRPYYDDPPYTVNVYYETSGLSVLGISVNEVGPWNENDNYWDTASSTPDRRMFDDLDLGEPEAEAAYYDDYNNGEDQFGRTVTNPAGIDLTPEVASDLGIGYLQNAWVWVRYSDLP